MIESSKFFLYYWEPKMVLEYLTFTYRQGRQRVRVKEVFGYLLDNPPPFQTLETPRFTPTRSKN